MLPNCIYVVLTDRCSNSCSFCYNKDSYAGRLDLSFLQWKSIFTDLLSWAPIRKVYLIGGEPLEYPEIDKLVEFLLSSGILVHLFSGGCDEEIYKMQKPILRQLSGVTVSFHGLESVVGVHTLRRQEAMVARMVEILGSQSDRDILINTTVSRLHAGFLLEIIEIVSSIIGRRTEYRQIPTADDRSYREYVCYPASEEGQSDVWHQFGWPFTSGKMKTAQDRLGWRRNEMSSLFSPAERSLLMRQDYVSEEGINVWNSVNGFPCSVDAGNHEGAVGIDRMTLRFDGHVVPCHINYQYSYGNALHTPTKDLWNNGYKLFREPSSVNVESVSRFLGLSSRRNCVAALQTGFSIMSEHDLVYGTTSQCKK